MSIGLPSQVPGHPAAAYTDAEPAHDPPIALLVGF